MSDSPEAQAIRNRIAELKHEIEVLGQTGTAAGVATLATATLGGWLLGALTGPIGLIGAGIASASLIKKMQEERNLQEEIKKLEALLATEPNA